MGWMRAKRPDLVPRYEQLYRRGAYAPQAERERLAALVRRGGKPGAFWRLRERIERDTGHPERMDTRHPEPERELQGTLF